MCSRQGCLAGHKANATNGLSVNGVIKIGLQGDKSTVYNVCVNQVEVWLFGNVYYYCNHFVYF